MKQRTKLTKRMLDDAIATDKPLFVWDGELRGFGLKVEVAGTKSFVLQYRTKARRKRRIVLGRYGVMSLEEARDQARAGLVLVAAGGDPADEYKKSSRKTVADICDWYLEEAEAGRLVGRRHRAIKASTLYMDRSRIETHIKPLIGQRIAAALTIQDIERMQADIAAGKTAKPLLKGRGRVTTGGAGAASRSVSTLQSLLGHAVRWGLLDRNPAEGVRKLAGQRRVRRLSSEEIVQFGEVMRKAASDGEHPKGLAVVRLILLTGFRLSEAQGLPRSWVNHAESWIEFADSKSDEHVRPIGKVALRHIEAQPQDDISPFLFPSDSGRGHFTATDSVIARLCKTAGLKDVTAHTLRHTFASIAGELGYSDIIIGTLLGHVARNVTQGYVHIEEAARIAADQVARTMAELLDGRRKSALSSRRAASIGPASVISSRNVADPPRFGGYATSFGNVPVKVTFSTQ